MVLFLNALREIKIDESNIHRRFMVLIGFNGEKKYIIKKITLPIYAGGWNLNTTFMVLDSPSVYKLILG